MAKSFGRGRERKQKGAQLHPNTKIPTPYRHTATQRVHQGTRVNLINLKHQYVTFDLKITASNLFRVSRNRVDGVSVSASHRLFLHRYFRSQRYIHVSSKIQVFNK